MGLESHDSNCSIEDTQELKPKKDYYFDKYNWIPS